MGRIFLVSLSAIIGVGKTTLIHNLQKSKTLNTMLPKTKLVFLKEPEEAWKEQIRHPCTREMCTIDHLQEFYTNRQVNAQTFQIFVFDTHISMIEEEVSKYEHEEQDVVIIVERNIYDQLLFWMKQIQDELQTSTIAHHAAYMRIWRRWKKFIPPVSLIFFLKTSTLNATMKRLEQRGDGDGISREYQADLFKLHEDFYSEPVAFPLEAPKNGIPCVHLNAEKPFEELALQMGHHLLKLIK